MRISSRALLVGACALALMGCGPASDASVVTNEVSESVPARIDDLTATVIGSGKIFSLSEEVIQKPVAFWFWAPG